MGNVRGSNLSCLWMWLKGHGCVCWGSVGIPLPSSTVCGDLPWSLCAGTANFTVRNFGAHCLGVDCSLDPGICTIQDMPDN